MYTPKVGDVFKFTHHPEDRYLALVERVQSGCTRYVRLSEASFRDAVEYGQDALPMGRGGGPINNVKDSKRAQFVREATTAERVKYGLLPATAENVVKGQDGWWANWHASQAKRSQEVSDEQYTGGPEAQRQWKEQRDKEAVRSVNDALERDMIEAVANVEHDLWPVSFGIVRRRTVIDALLPVFRKHAAALAALPQPQADEKGRPLRVKNIRTIPAWGGGAYGPVPEGTVLTVNDWAGGTPHVRGHRIRPLNGFYLQPGEWEPAP